MSKYIGQLRDQLVQTLNTTFGTKYVFGGYDTTGYKNASGEQTPPFTVSDDGKLLFNGCDISDMTSPGNGDKVNGLADDTVSFNIGVGIDLEIMLNGINVAKYNADGDNLFSLLNGLFTDLENGETADVVNKYIPKLQEAQNHLLGHAATIGGATNRLDLLSSRYAQDEINYTQMLSDAEDADEAEVIMNFKMAEAVYNAALAAGASIIQPTLMDFLR
jgi:flagellar hook-associated protein 3 FlgL